MTSTVRRTANPDTIQRDITAWELAKLLALEISYDPAALDAMTPEHRALTERHSRPAGLDPTHWTAPTSDS